MRTEFVMATVFKIGKHYPERGRHFSINLHAY
jgi:hypothetical protein